MLCVAIRRTGGKHGQGPLQLSLGVGTCWIVVPTNEGTYRGSKDEERDRNVDDGLHIFQAEGLETILVTKSLGRVFVFSQDKQCMMMIQLIVVGYKLQQLWYEASIGDDG